ncbi:uncharacterized protein LOC122298830 [Carya illinoinensis]|uniref:uncharacterized protein LOC122298830 n=1 Tax=Carya illinoinensis TaxID=32201 RepID=UPI001C72317E|nr:uncharacterized protein LOC122298830 [Carya illinoinensis]
MARGYSDVNGVPYKIFHWTPGFNEEDEPPLVPVWLTIPGLPPNYFQTSMLKSFGDGLGRFLKCDNATLKQGHSEGSCKSKSQYNLKGKKKVDSVANGKGLENKVWKVVGEKKTEEKVQVEEEEKEIPSGRRKQILDRIAQKQSIAQFDQLEILFMDSNGVLFSQPQALLEENGMKMTEAIRLMEPEEERAVGQNVYKDQSAGKLSWYEGSENLGEKDEGDDLVANRGSPRSSLKLIDEALEGEVYCNAIGNDNCLRYPFLAHSLTDNDNEDEIEELATKGICSSKASLRQIKNKYRPSVVGILEPFLSVNKCAHWARWLRLPNFCNHVEVGGKVWLFWADGIEFQLHSVMAQALSGWFSLGNSRVLATFIYASCFQEQRRVLWSYLQDLDGGDNIPWFLGGDFNIIRSEGEKIGGCNGRLGGGRIWARLDRVLEGWSTPFRFQRMWCLHEDFLGVVSECWRQEFQDSPMVKFSRKLKKLKQVLKKWNREVFGKVEVDLKVIEEELLALENNVQQNYTQDMEVELLRCKQKHLQYLHREEIMGCQKSRVKWICEGDENTAFFHASLRCKKKFKALESMILEDGSVLDSSEAVLEGPVDFFQQQLTTSAVSFEEPGMNLTTSIITEDDNQFLGRVPNLMEVKEALWSIPQDSSPGPDGFSASFFHHAWDIIKEDLLMLAIEFFEGKPLTTFFGATNIVLIPKVDDLRGFSQFRPISLCSIVYKILSKVLVNRLEPIMKKIISAEQSAFIKGRSIFDNISIAQEMVQSMNKKVRGGNVMIKIDMAKAYDRVNWRFLLEVMRRLGFSDHWRGLIFNCISSPMCSVMLNGSLKGFFKPSRGIRQEDPLSPYLFILSQELLSRMINVDFQQERVKPFNSNGGTLISHLFYADDVLIFSNGGKRSLLQIMKTLQAYQSMSGQMVQDFGKELNCPFSHVRKKSMKAIAWIKPNRGQYKLNVDGSSLRNPGLAGGGGVVRDHDGRVLVGFAIHYGQVSNNVAEGRALLDGLKLA